MDILVMAYDHPNATMISQYSEDNVHEAFGHYDFITTCKVKVRTPKETQTDEYEVILEMNMKRSQPVSCSASHKSDMRAVKSAIKKARTLIEKYKEKRYHKKR